MTMNLAKLKSGTSYAPVEVGVYPGRVVQIIDLGRQKQEFNGEPKDPKNEISITYELSNEFLPDENGEDDETKPRWQHEKITLNPLTSDRAKSTARYKALDPNMEFGGDFSKVLGTPCMITIDHKPKKNSDEVYVNVASVATMRAKDAKICPELVNEPKLFTLDDPDLEVFRTLPQFQQDYIKGNLDYRGSKLEAMLEGSSVQEVNPDKASVEVSDEEETDEPW